MELKVRTYSVGDVLAGKRTEFDTSDFCNAPLEVKVRNKTPGNTDNWIEKFHKNYHVLTINKEDIPPLSRIRECGYISGRVGDIFEDEMESIVKKYESKMPTGRWFVKTDTNSLKTGCHGAGPFTSFRSIVEGMCTTLPYHRCFEIDDLHINLYFIPWIDMERDRELRVYVYNNRITAISAQYIYEVNDWLTGMSNKDRIKTIKILLGYFDNVIKDRMSYMGSYTMDVFFGDDNTVYFIEPNVFGAENEGSSKLFHWLKDHDTLHGQNPLELRFCDRNN